MSYSFTQICDLIEGIRPEYLGVLKDVVFTEAGQYIRKHPEIQFPWMKAKDEITELVNYYIEKQPTLLPDDILTEDAKGARRRTVAWAIADLLRSLKIK